MTNSDDGIDAADLVAEAWGDAARIRETMPLAGDASTRRYTRLWLDGPAPPTAILMVQPDPASAPASEEVDDPGLVVDEPPFLNVHRYLQSVDIAVPATYTARPDGSRILLEDVGDRTLWEEGGARTPERRFDLYRRAVDIAVRLQEAGTRRPDRSCIAFRRRFDAPLFLQEFDHFLEYGFTGRSAVPEDLQEARRHFEALADELGSERRFLTHRDFHSWNLHVTEKTLRVLDFQDALLAPAAYDLASLFTDRRTPDRIDPAMEEGLIDHYLRRRDELLGDAPEAAGFRRLYDGLVLQRALKVVGRFHFLEDVKGKRGYRAMIPHALATVRRSLERRPDLAPLARVLARSFPELQ